MKKITLIFPAFIFAAFLLNGCCKIFPDRCCIKNPVEDGAKPVAGISVVYKHNGQEVIKTFNSSMTQPSSLMGFDVFLPPCTSYALLLNGKDGSGVSAMKLASVEFANTSNMTVTKPYFTIFNRDLKSCVKKNHIFSHSVKMHNDRRMHYELAVTDISGAKSSVKILVVPEFASGGCGDSGTTNCLQFGGMPVGLFKQSGGTGVTWKGSILQTSLDLYCKNLFIKEISVPYRVNCGLTPVCMYKWQLTIAGRTYADFVCDTTGSCKKILASPIPFNNTYEIAATCTDSRPCNPSDNCVGKDWQNIIHVTLQIGQ